MQSPPPCKLAPAIWFELLTVFSGPSCFYDCELFTGNGGMAWCDRFELGITMFVICVSLMELTIED